MLFVIWIVSIVATMIIADRKGLNVVRYFLAALILGPIEVIVVLCARSKINEFSKVGEDMTLDEVKQQLFELTNGIKVLNAKANVLEANLKILSGEDAKISSLSDEGNVPVVGDQKVVNVPLAQQAGEHKATKSIISTEYEERFNAPKPSEGFEQIFGKYWLSRIGVVLFVMGIGLFISYSFQYLNAFAKVGIGYAFAIAFFVWGNILEKNQKYTKISWGILGGAWGLLYLSTYALHYIQVTKVISNPMIETLLLSIVSIAAVFYNLKYQSWIVTAITFILAFITAGLGTMDYSSVAYFSLLVGCIAFLSYKRQWHYSLLAGVVGNYLVRYCEFPLRSFHSSYWGHGASFPMDHFRIIFSILVISWAVFSFVFFLMKHKNEDERNILVASQLVNAGFFTLMGFFQINRIQSYWKTGWDKEFWFLIILAGIYFIFAYVFKQIKQSKMIVINSAIAFLLIGWAILIKMPDASIAFYWILEMMMLFVLGVYYKEQIFRYMSGALSVCVVVRLFAVDYFSAAHFQFAGLTIDHNLLVFGFAAVCFYVLGALIAKDRFGIEIDREERDLYSWVYPIFATVLLTFIFGREIASVWLSLSWTLLGASLLCIGFFLKNKIFRLNALGLLCLSALRVIFIDMSGVNTLYKIAAFTVLGALLLGISMVYSKYKIKEK